MAKTMETSTSEVPINTPHPSEKMFAADHPELVVTPAKKEDRSALKDAFMADLDTIQEDTTEKEKPKKTHEETPKKESETEQPAEEEAAPAPKEQPAEEEAAPEEVEEDKDDDVEKDDEARIKQYAEKNGITQEEARAEIEEYEDIAKKYDNDPIKIAKAYKNIQSSFEKQKVEQTQSQQARIASQIMAQGAEKFVSNAEKENAPKWIAEYKAAYPAESEILTDAVILERCRQLAIGKVKDQMREYETALAKDSSLKREKLIQGLSPNDRRYTSEISNVLKKLPDIQIMHPNFNFHDAVRWARGEEKNIARVEKEAYEKGFKAAKGGEIIGEIITKAPGSSKPRIKESRPSQDQLSASEQKLARLQYASIPGTDEDRYAAYLDVKNSRRKK